MRKTALQAGGVLLAVLAVGTSSAGGQWIDVGPALPEGTMAPRLTRHDGGLLLSWILDTDTGARFQFARRRGENWSEVHTVAEGTDLIANWADTPVLHSGDDGLWASWPSRFDGEGYGIRVARSADDGLSWTEPQWLHEDMSDQEHGFATFTANDRAVWLDGAEMAAGGAMRLLTRRPAGRSREVVLDDRVCECCSIDSATPHRGPVIVYRDRSQDEVRDIAIVRETGSGWEGPTLVSEDGWRIEGCPVQGPAVAALGDRAPTTHQSDLLLVAWFTLVENRPLIRVALSEDAGATFSPPMRANRFDTVGRVDAILVDEVRGYVSWIGKTEDDVGQVTVIPVGVAGSFAPPDVVGQTTAGRASGFPKMEIYDDRLFIAWTQATGAGPTQVRLSAKPL